MLATYASILTPAHSNDLCQVAFTAGGTLSYHVLAHVPSFGAQLEPRYIFRAVAFDQ